MRIRFVVAILLAGAGIASQHVHAQGDYPNRPIRLVVGFPPGGATDIFARLLSVYMPESIGQPEKNKGQTTD